MINVITDTKISRVLNAVAAGTSAQNGSVVDTKGYHGCAFVVALGDVTATCVLTAKVQQGDLADGSDMADVSGVSTTFTAGATDADNKLLLVEIIKPRKRYVRVVVTRTTANAVIDGAFAVLTAAAADPVTQGSDVIGTPTLGLSPA